MEQVRELDASSTHGPVPDLFGILRRRGTGLAEGCCGYHPQGVVCPSPESELDFPTFCQNCGCPAYFHQIVKAEGTLPEPLAATIGSFNIRQSDINFNSAFIALEIKDQAR